MYWLLFLSALGSAANETDTHMDPALMHLRVWWEIVTTQL